MNETPHKQAGKQKVIVSALLFLAVVVIFVLPNWVTEPWIADSKQAENTAQINSPAVVSPSLAAEKSKYRQDAQTILAEIILRRERLQQQQVNLWADIDFSQAVADITGGDEQYAIGNYAESVARYQRSLDTLKALEERGVNLLQQSITEARTAIAQRDLDTARRTSALAQAMAPENNEVQKLAQRATLLPALIDLMQRSQALSAAGDFTGAITPLAEAVALDPDHQEAAAALVAIDKKITQERFNNWMSRGFSALSEDQLDTANRAFAEAEKVYPGNTTVTQALSQVENRRAQRWVNDGITKAKALEDAEKWSEAEAVYRELLATDPTLSDIKVRQLPVAVRADLDQKIRRTLDDPLALYAPKNYQRGQSLLQDAEGIPNPVPVLRDQIARLKHHLAASQTPIEVQLVSDQFTEVTLFRVAKLGQFDRTSVALKPGRYIIAGTRAGYRDVRIEFTLTDSGLKTPIEVICSDLI